MKGDVVGQKLASEDGMGWLADELGGQRQVDIEMGGYNNQD